VPGLGDLPVIGGLFSNRAKSITSTEIVVLITPRIVNYAEPQFHEADEMRRVDVIKRIIDEELGATEEKMEQIFDGKNNYQRVETDRR
jgi:type II secretory pathway component GspD/PulD (secretin)